MPKSRKTTSSKVSRLTKAAHGLNEIVEGVNCKRWASENGFRLRDTNEWVEFYLALKAIEEAPRSLTPNGKE